MPIVIIIILFLWWQNKNHQHLHAICDSHLLPYLLQGQSSGQKLIFWILGLSWFIAIFALAGPSLKQNKPLLYQSSYSRIFVLNLSKSMLAQDTQPNRLSIARFKLLELLKQSQDIRTALIVFSQRAYIVSPLTKDSQTISATVPLLSPKLMPATGNNPAAGLDQALKLFEQAKTDQGQVILITDSAGQKKTLTAAKKLKEAGFSLDILAIGTKEGAPIPKENGQFIKENNQLIISQLSPKHLKALAKIGGGSAYFASTTNQDIHNLLKQGNLHTHYNQSTQAHSSSIWENKGPYIALLLLPLVLFAFRRGWLNPLAIAFISTSSLPPSPSHASIWPDLWLNKNQQAIKQLTQHQYESAAHIFTDPLWQGYAYYRDKKYKQALASFRKENSALSYYNQGNTLAQLGHYQQAITSYQKALEQDPNNQDAKFNKKLLEKLLKQKSQQDQNKNQDKNQDKTVKQSELSQSLSQWLRQIPDDPGGLLKRDFKRQDEQQQGQ
ncbi:vWA domain-containing protein [Piscirickettsia salmonis]|uniref:vWA domain-containing protein n=1 Tax=Piscirickettsia salmonis TaxID=1238 RepID=UPI0018ACA3F1|nr:VWA domain-containing protein [Piscirickettsia salmonis]